MLADTCREVTNYASYLVELSLPDYGMLKYPYSMISAAAVYAANTALGRWAPSRIYLRVGLHSVTVLAWPRAYSPI